MLAASEKETLQDFAERYRERVLVGQRVLLPGPTGEENTLEFHPRTPVLAMAQSPCALLHQMLAAFACNADVVLVKSAAANDLLSRLPRILTLRISLVESWQAATFGVVLFDGPAQEAAALREELAASNGPIRGVVMPSPVYDLTAMVVERTVTINTAAAGGNARLATLEA
jgi:RHH-type proline utilization regulon transcriptional repressor/proline dehydrogenase/delta 1-pyrroline-5-carboxylate dehydrogenase